MLLISPALALGIHFSVDEGCPKLTSHSMKEAAPRVSIPDAAERAAYLSDAWRGPGSERGGGVQQTFWSNASSWLSPSRPYLSARELLREGSYWDL